ncbi:MAG: hypothetical protein ABI861_09890 [Panacibacter sp.]
MKEFIKINPARFHSGQGLSTSIDALSPAVPFYFKDDELFFYKGNMQ